METLQPNYNGDTSNPTRSSTIQVVSNEADKTLTGDCTNHSLRWSIDDPNINYFQPFEVEINGEIESAQLSRNSSWTSLFIQTTACCGDNWELISGETSIVTPVTQTKSFVYQLFDSLDAPPKIGLPDEFCFNHPFNFQFQSSSPIGWPRLMLTLYASNYAARRVNTCQYGSVTIPTQSGRYIEEVPLVQPLHASVWDQFENWCKGTRLELVDKTAFTLPEGRDSLRVQTEGRVKLKLDIIVSSIDDAIPNK